MDWLDLLAVQGTLKSLLKHHSSKALGSSKGEDVLWELEKNETRQSRATIQGGTLKPNYELNSMGKS